MDIEIFLEQLKKIGNAERADWDKNYHKSNRLHFGASVPNCKKLLNKYCKDFSEDQLLSFACKLWNTHIFDAMICAAKVLTHSKLSESKEIWSLLIYFLKDVDGWALEDNLAPVAWQCIIKNNSLVDEVESWIDNSNLWMRRAALVYTLPFAKKGQDHERMLLWASHLSIDNQWFIQKAIGWWLRELGKHNPERVIKFLNNNWTNLKSVARREATRKLSQDWLRQLKI
jgi:3-methyladenine DNA glycosylase AlkD